MEDSQTLYLRISKPSKDLPPVVRVPVLNAVLAILMLPSLEARMLNKGQSVRQDEVLDKYSVVYDQSLDKVRTG